MRSLLSVLLIAVPVTLILTLVGVTHGMLEDSQRRARGTGADVLVRGSTASSILSTTAASINEKLVPFIEQQSHVAMATGVLSHNVDPPLALMGVDLEELSKMTGGIDYVAGGPFQGPDDMLIDSQYAAQTGKSVGSTVRLINHDWRVSGVMRSGKLARLAVPLKTLQNLDDAQGKLTVIYVKADDPSHDRLVADELQKLLPSAKVITLAEYVAMYSITAPGMGVVRAFTAVVMAIGVIIGFAVVCLSQYMAVLQRTREIGILKSLGGSKGFILSIVVVEALGLGIGGTLLGILLSYGASWLINTLVPASWPMVIVPEWWPIAGAVTLAASAFGALYPGLSAASHDPIEALAYE